MPVDTADIDHRLRHYRDIERQWADSLYDLDELQRDGVTAADESLTVLRAMLTPHYLHYMGTFPMQGGMLGRG